MTPQKTVQNTSEQLTRYLMGFTNGVKIPKRAACTELLTISRNHA